MVYACEQANNYGLVLEIRLNEELIYSSKTIVYWTDSRFEFSLLVYIHNS